MKKVVIISLVTCLSVVFVANAQEMQETQEIQEKKDTQKTAAVQVVHEATPIQEVTKSMSQGQHNALILQLHNASMEEVKVAWKKFVKTYKGKTKKGTLELFTDNAKIPSLSPTTVDIYATFEPIHGGTEMAAWFNLGETYVSYEGNPEQYKTAEGILQSFSTTYYKNLAVKNAKLQAKQLKKEIKKLGKLQKTHNKYLAKIEAFKQKIKDFEQKVENNKKAQAEQEAKIDQQQEAVDAAQAKLNTF